MNVLTTGLGVRARQASPCRTDDSSRPAKSSRSETLLLRPHEVRFAGSHPASPVGLHRGDV